MSRQLQLLLCGWLIALLAGCQAERYFGPYRLELPTELHERSAYRTFRLPLDEDDQREQADLDYCLQTEPDRETPCGCDYPVLKVDEQALRLDYRLAHTAGGAVNASVWIGTQAPAGEPDPALVPDLPRIELWAVHLHRLQAGERIDDLFSEEELHQADLAWATDRWGACDAEVADLPAPLAWRVGLSLTEGESAEVWLEYTARVRAGD